MKSGRKKQNTNENIHLKMGKQILTGTIVGTIFFFLVILTFSFLVIKSEMSESMQNILSFLAAILSAFVGGYISSRKLKTKGLLMGGMTALAQALVISIVLLAVLHDIGLKTLLMLVAMLLGGAFGGITAVNKKKKR